MAQIEQWDVNLKAPGGGRAGGAGGAYRKGDIGKQADWMSVYDNVQKSIQYMGKQVGEYIKKDQEILKTLKDKDENFQKGIENMQEGGNAALEAVSDQILEDVHTGEGTSIGRMQGKLDDPDKDMSDKRKKRIEDRIKKKTKTEWHELTRKEKKQAIEKLDMVQGLKNQIQSVTEQMSNADPASLNWSNFAKNPKVKAFYHHILKGGKGDASELFSIDVSGAQPKIVWQTDGEITKGGDQVEIGRENIWADAEGNVPGADAKGWSDKKLKRKGYTIQGTKGIMGPKSEDKLTFTDNELSLADLTSGSNIFENATEDRNALTGLLDKAATEGITKRKAWHKGPDMQTGGEEWDSEAWIEEQIELIAKTDPSNFEFIFNNMTPSLGEGKEGNMMTHYDTNNTQHDADVKEYISEYLRDKIGAAPAVREPVEDDDGGSEWYKSYGWGSAPSSSEKDIAAQLEAISSLEKVDQQGSELGENMAGVTSKEELNKRVDAGEDLLPKSGTKQHEELERIWNTNPKTGEYKRGLDPGLSTEELKDAVEWGLENDGDFSKFEGKYKDYNKNVFDRWNEMYGVSKAYGDRTGTLGDEETLANIDRLFDISSTKHELQGKKISGAAYIERNSNGDRILKIPVTNKTGVKIIKYDPIEYNLDDVQADKGLKQLYIDLTGATSAKRNEAGSKFDYMVKKIRSGTKGYERINY